MVPTKIGRYEIVGQLGRGGMAVVYRAHDAGFARDVAVKVLPRELLNEANFRARFEREARMIASLEHPAIVPVYDHGEEDGQPYIVMRLMSGGSLSDRLRSGAMPVHEVTRILTALAPALDRAHAKGIIHRDLKPSNILFDEDGNPYLADFGLARLTEASTVMTRTGVLGTPAYMSPEQAMGAKDLDARTDLYALGVIVFHMLTGQLPFDADSAIAMVAQHVNAPVPRIRAFKTDLPAKADQLINKAMAKRREVRYQNAGSIAADLATWPGSSRAPATPKPPRWLGPEIAGKATAARVPPAAAPSARAPAATAVPAGRTESLDRPSTPAMAPPRRNSLLLAGGLLALGMVPLAVLGLVLGLLFAKGGGTSATQTPPAATVTQPAAAAAQATPIATSTAAPTRTPRATATAAPSITPMLTASRTTAPPTPTARPINSPTRAPAPTNSSAVAPPPTKSPTVLPSPTNSPTVVAPPTSVPTIAAPQSTSTPRTFIITATNNLSFVTVLWIDGVFKASFQPGQTHAVPVLEGPHVAQLCNEGAPPNDPNGCGGAIPLTADADFSWTFDP